jgi:hypothetical protein
MKTQMHNTDYLPFRRFVSLSAQRPSIPSLLKHNKGYKFYKKTFVFIVITSRFPCLTYLLCLI